MSRWPLRPCLLLAAIALAGCVKDEDLDAPWTDEERAIIATLVLDDASAAPPPSPGNPWADDERAQALGRTLFFDPGLSEDGDLSCASCHAPERYFQDAQRRSLGRGGRALQRNAPSVIGAVHYPFLTWDGGRDSVWAQALGPIEDPNELGATRTGLAHHVSRAHRAAYEGTFGPLPPLDDAKRFPARAGPAGGAERRDEQRRWQQMTLEDRRAVDEVMVNVARALEAWQRTLSPRPAPFDAYAKALLEGDAEGGGHLSPGARRGLRLFIGRGGCVECHRGPRFTDGEFHNLGVPRPEGVLRVDPGRSDGARRVKADPFRCGTEHSRMTTCDALEFLDPDFEDFVGAFRTPSLRNVAETGPYMHAGQFLSLLDVVEFYKRLPGQPALGHRDLRLKRLGSTFPSRDMVLFLRSLTGPLPEGVLPPPAHPADAAVAGDP